MAEPGGGLVAITKHRQNPISIFVKEEEVESMQSLNQEQDDEELLNQQLHDTLFSHIKDIPSSDGDLSPQQQQRQQQSDDDLFYPEEDMIDESSPTAYESTPSMGYALLASPTPSSLIQTTPAGQVLSPSNTQYVIPLSEMAFLRTQVADQPRIPWRWSTTGKKDSSPYKPIAVGKWWYDYWVDSQNDNKMESAASHIGRIMETELGVQFLGDTRCTLCQRNGRECWVYSERGRKQIRHPGSACAHCRARGPVSEGCSVATRRPCKKRNSHRVERLQNREENREILPMQPKSSSPAYKE